MEVSDISVDIEDSDVEVCVIDDDEEEIGQPSSAANSEGPDIRPNDNAGNADNGPPPSKILSADRRVMFNEQPEMLHDYAKVKVKLEDPNDEGQNLLMETRGLIKCKTEPVDDIIEHSTPAGNLQESIVQEKDSMSETKMVIDEMNKRMNYDSENDGYDDDNDDDDDDNEDENNDGDDDDDDDEDDDDGDDANVEFFTRFQFESDHLAFKHNKDYKTLLKTLIVLEAERMRSVQELQDLHIWKDKALKDPISFVESLQSKNPPKLPERREITPLPNIDWMQYLTSADMMKLPSGIQVNTRRSFRSKGEASNFQGPVKLECTGQDDSDSLSTESGQEQSKFLRGRLLDDNKTMTFNRLWTTEEQEKLEKLLTIYPPEDVEARRWEKIARALGNRTAKQVSSRVQKYFIKLARAGLPIPGRVPHLTTQRKAKINPMSYRNSTFFPSWKPSVYMNDDDDDDDDASSVTTMQSDDTPCVSDEEMIPTDLKNSDEYKELMNLKRHRKELQEVNCGTVHNSYLCDLCGMDPIRGIRWHCTDCPDGSTFDLCHTCNNRNPQGIPNLHPIWHRMTAIEESTAFVDGDYVGFKLQQGKYNYLDPNFIPKSR